MTAPLTPADARGDEGQLKRDLALAPDPGGQRPGDSVYGHVTARLPGWDRFWMKPAWLGLEEIREEHLILVDLDGTVLAGDQPRHSEYPIHAEIMRHAPMSPRSCTRTRGSASRSRRAARRCIR